MAVNKSETFDEALQALAAFGKAIGHPARMEILRVLAEKNMCICGEIVDVLPLSQSTVSQHLKELKKVGLISGEVEGVRSCYCINWEKLEIVMQQLNGYYEAIKAYRDKTGCC